MSSGEIHMVLDPDHSLDRVWSGRNGKTTPNPYSLVETRINNTCPEMWEYKYIGVPPDWYYWTYSARSWHSSMKATLALAAWQNEYLDCVTKIADQMRSFDASVFLGTMGQTVDLVVDRASRVLDAFIDVKRGRYQKAARTLFGEKRRKLTTGSPGQVWLEWQYGWAPLLSDVYEGCEAIQKALEKRKLTLRSRKSRSVDTVVNTRGVIQRAQSIVQIIAILDEQPGAMNRWGLTDPATLAWELLPWSFVVDWFVPVGDFLSNRSVLHGVRGSFVISRMRKATIQHTYPITTVGNLRFANGALDMKLVQFNRTIADSLGVPLPSVKTMEQAFSLGHLANAAALISQKVKLSRDATPY